MQSFRVSAGGSGSRLDVYLKHHIPHISRSSVQKLCSTGKVEVNGKPEPAKYKLKPEDKIQVDFDPTQLKEIPDIDLPILYEDDETIVINKPSGVLTHSKGAFNPEATVATFIANKVRDMDGDRAGIVHRLDRGTSGVIIAAKSPEALKKLQKQFSQRKVKKEYVAVVQGQPSPASAVIESSMDRNPRDPKKFRVSAGGREAVTIYETTRTGKGRSLLLLHPKTGRTHQLRVHMATIKHPILGDELYGGEAYNRLMLHAKRLEITLPSGERKVFEAPLPIEFKEATDG